MVQRMEAAVPDFPGMRKGPGPLPVQSIRDPGADQLVCMRPEVVFAQCDDREKEMDGASPGIESRFKLTGAMDEPALFALQIQKLGSHGMAEKEPFVLPGPFIQPLEGMHQIAEHECALALIAPVQDRGFVPAGVQVQSSERARPLMPVFKLCHDQVQSGLGDDVFQLPPFEGVVDGLHESTSLVREIWIVHYTTLADGFAKIL